MKHGFYTPRDILPSNINNQEIRNMALEKNMTFSRSAGGEKIALESGTYEAHLFEVANGVMRAFQSEETIPCIKFRFDIHTDDGTAYVWKDVAPSINERSNLSKMFKGMTGQAFSPDLPDTEIIKLLEGLVGKSFLVTIEQKQSKASGALYNKFVAVSRRAPQKLPAAAVTHNDDDIPF